MRFFFYILHISHRFSPWQRKTSKGIQKFIDEKWTNVDDVTKIVKPEAQAWFCVRQLLLNPQIMENYAFNEARCKQLHKVRCHLHISMINALTYQADFLSFWVSCTSRCWTSCRHL